MPLPPEKTTNLKPLLLMLDYDGTLTPIVEHYEQALISQDRIAVLQKLSRLPNIQLAIVSGRSVETLCDFLKPLTEEAVYLVGLHGGQLYDAQNHKFLMEPSPEYKEQVKALKDYLLEHHIEDLPGIELEDKGFSLGLHYRLATKETAHKALEIFKAGYTHLHLHAGFIMRAGKQLLEVVPSGFNKGVGVRELLPLAQHRFREKPGMVYIGDDITDFDAFRVVNDEGGFSVYVGKTLTSDAPPVSQVLPDVESVYQFLEGGILAAV